MGQRKGRFKTDEAGKNVRIPIEEYNTIKAFVKEKKYTLGGFIAIAALEKIGRLRNAEKV